MKNFVDKYAELRDKEYVKRLQSEGRIAAQIKIERKKLEMSQQTLADLAEVPKSTISSIEAGLTSPKADTLTRISKGLDTDFAIEDTGEDKESHNL